MLSHPTHAINPRKSSFTRHFVQPHNIYEVNKMQQSTQSAHPAQNTQANGIIFVVLFSLALLLAYAVNQHLVTDCFVGLLSLFFDSFSVKTSSILTDIAMLY
jgi:hypothetical protein